jgi:hypothetical protein
MDDTQIQDLAIYILDLEETLNESDHDDIAIQAEIPTIKQNIQLLMDHSFNPAEDMSTKMILAHMEMKLRKSLDFIEKRVGVSNFSPNR